MEGITTTRYISCPGRLYGGEPCPSKFTRSSNLYRHMRKYHAELPVLAGQPPADLTRQSFEGDRAVQAGSPQSVSNDTESYSPVREDSPISESQAQAHPSSGRVSEDDAAEGPTGPYNAANPSASKRASRQFYETPPAKRLKYVSVLPDNQRRGTEQQADEASRQEHGIEQEIVDTQEPDIATPALEPERASESPRQQCPPTSPTCTSSPRWRGTAASMLSLPRYEVRASQAQPGQPKALTWLSQAAKNAFYTFQVRALAKWGVSPDHTGSCVMDPAEWADLEPLDLMQAFDHRTSPTAHSQNRTFKYDDHCTNLPRANAWFGSWPHTGVELDNFLGDGPFKPMQGSHLCHHDNCIVPAHVVYEAADVNMGRKECHKLALRLRSMGTEVPRHCRSHEPPCFLRHAALSTFEIYLIQFYVLRTAREIPHPASLQKPRWHLFPTFEVSLPIRLPSVSGEDCLITADNLVPAVHITPPPRRPQLKCGLCVRTKAYARLTPLWSHVVRQHDDIADDERLAEIRRTAKLWQLYWRSRDQGKADKLTLARMNEALGPDFSWERVIAWGLR